MPRHQGSDPASPVRPERIFRRLVYNQAEHDRVVYRLHELEGCRSEVSTRIHRESEKYSRT